jgi:hypothetical protein
LKRWGKNVDGVGKGEDDPAYVTAMSEGANVWGKSLRGELGSNTVIAPDGTVVVKPEDVDLARNAMLAAQMNQYQWYTLVKYGGFWDYKQHRQNGKEVYETFGNYHYGATGMALFNEGVLLREAGRRQLKQSHHGPGKPPFILGRSTGGVAPFGDYSNDQKNISRGCSWHRNNKRQLGIG